MSESRGEIDIREDILLPDRKAGKRSPDGCLHCSDAFKAEAGRLPLSPGIPQGYTIDTPGTGEADAVRTPDLKRGAVH